MFSEISGPSTTNPTRTPGSPSRRSLLMLLLPVGVSGVSARVSPEFLVLAVDLDMDMDLDFAQWSGTAIHTTDFVVMVADTAAAAVAFAPTTIVATVDWDR